MSNYSTSSDIKQSLLSIYDKIQSNSTKEVGYELYKKLISQNITEKPQISQIIQNVSEYLSSLNGKDKEKGLKLLALIFYDSQTPKYILYAYIPSTLSVLQVLIKDVNSALFPSISQTYAEIVQATMPTELEASYEELVPEEKKAYEILQGFCVYNMKYEDKANKICGSLCLTKLVENCPIVLKPNYLKFIWENIVNFIDKKNFNAKYELLNCLISLILGAEGMFQPYANVTVFKVMSYLTDNDWLKRKLALNVLYTIAFYCKDELVALKEHVFDFLKLLKTDKVKEVREVALSILKILNDGEEKKLNKSTEEIRTKKKTNINTSFNSNNVNNISTNNVSTNNQRGRVNTENERKRSITPNRLVKKKKEKDDLNTSNVAVGKSANMVNRKDNSFINEKMVIKTDPKRSAFREGKNANFFKKPGANQDIIVVDKRVVKTEREREKEKEREKENEDIEMHNDDIVNQGDSNMFANIGYNSVEVRKSLNNEDIKMKSINEEEVINTTPKLNEKTSSPIFGTEKDENIITNPHEHSFANANTNVNASHDFDHEPKFSFRHTRQESPNLGSGRNKYSYNFNSRKKDDSSNLLSTNEKPNKIEDNYDNISSSKHQNKLLESKKEEPKQNTELINKLLSQMNSLSQKQLVLLDTIDQIQTDTNNQISGLNDKIEFLSQQIVGLSAELSVIKSQPQAQSQSELSSQLSSALRLDDQSMLISLISRASISQLKTVENNIIEDVALRLITVLSKGESTKCVIGFYKMILLGMKIGLRKVVLQNIKEILEYVSNENVEIGEEDMIDVNIILNYLNNLNKY